MDELLGTNKREIKFRAWDKQQKRMLQGYTPDNHPKREIILIEFCIGFSGYNLGDLEIMQYTCRKDEKGKEIYEGDIIKLKRGLPNNYVYPLVIVEWDNETGGWHLMAVHPYEVVSSNGVDMEKMRELGYLDELGENDVVVGDIYQNPELFKVSVQKNKQLEVKKNG